MRRSLAFILWAGVAGCVTPQARPTEAPETAPAADAITRPVPDPSNAPIAYTSEALEHMVEGTMVVRCLITADGRVTEAEAVSSLPDMEQAVLTTVSSWHFKPATRDGKPIALRYELPVRLQLDELAGAAGPTVTFVEGKMTRPIPDPKNAIITLTREDLENRLNGTFLVQTVIAADGRVHDAHVIRMPTFTGPSGVLDRTTARIVATISGWRFTPVTLEGKPVAVKYVVPVRFIVPR